jgi:hypothetical protein
MRIHHLDLDTATSSDTTTTTPAISPGKSTLAEKLARFARGTEPVQAHRDAPAGDAARAEEQLLLISHDLPRAGGAPLPAPVQAKMSRALGADFSGVRVHQDERAGAIGANAFASGDDVHFAAGTYDPASRAGQELIGHELAHVVQQRAGRVSATAQASGLVDGALEQEADALGAQAAASGESRRVAGDGGYVYQQFADGTIEIVEGPKNVGKVYPPGDRVNAAITAQIGPFPAAAPAPAAPAPVPVEEGTGIPSLDDILTGIGEAIGGVGETIGGIVDGITGAIGGFFGTTPEETAPPTGEAPATEPAAPAGPTDPAFLDQRDNEFDKDGVSGDKMCSVTSLAMQLIALRGGDAERVKQESATLIAAHGGAAPSKEQFPSQQPEDFVMMVFDALAAKGYWAGKKDETEAPFYAGWTKQAQFAEGKFHQMGVCQAHVLAMYGSVQSDNQSAMNAGKTLKAFLLEDIRPQLAQGTAFSASTRLTGGHVVVIVSVLDDGLVIHDPFGARLPQGHLRNGDSNPTDDASKATYPVRFRENPTLLEATRGAEPATRSDWGASNYFTWAEVDTWQIGYSVTSASLNGA